jgi:uncharacterized membrane protein
LESEGAPRRLRVIAEGKSMRRDRLETALIILLCLAALSPAAAAQTTAQGSDAMEYVNVILRWAHVLFGILWIGHLYFFNFVQGGFEGKLAADVKKVVIPELRPRALFWFRWGAMWTWVTGIFLLGVVYYMGFKNTWSADKPMGYAMVGAIFVAFFVYDVIAKKLGAMTPAGLVANLVLLAVMIVLFGMVGKMDGRALFIHTGGLLGTTMMLNVWMRIWPAQRQIITAIKAGNPPDAALVALAGGRSRQNTYMSVPLLLLMVSNHYPALYGGTTPEVKNYIILALVIGIGFASTKMLFQKAAKVTGF